MKIIIGADLVPTQSNLNCFILGDALNLVGEKLYQQLMVADYRIFNLELAIADKGTPAEKYPALIAPTSALTGYKALNVDVLSIANNHIMDHRESGIYSTMNALKSNGIAFVGGGNTITEAARPYIFTQDGKKIGIYACAEHEFSIAGENSPGANPFDPLESPDHVAELKKQCDFVIVLYHGGKEHYRYPSPNLQKVCRKLIEKGADLVVCQHSHCVGCEEKYQGGTIVYGQGNFLFDHSESEFWQTSLLVQIGDGFAVSYIPLRKKGNGVRLAEGADAEGILQEFYCRSEEIKKDGMVQQKYRDYAKTARLGYLSKLSGKESMAFRVLNKLLGNKLRKWKLKQKYDRATLFYLKNYTKCEAHLELIQQIIENDLVVE